MLFKILFLSKFQVWNHVLGGFTRSFFTCDEYVRKIVMLERSLILYAKNNYILCRYTLFQMTFQQFTSLKKQKRGHMVVLFYCWLINNFMYISSQYTCIFTFTYDNIQTSDFIFMYVQICHYLRMVDMGQRWKQRASAIQISKFSTIK